MQANVNVVLTLIALLGRVFPKCIKTQSGQFRKITVPARGIGAIVNDSWLLGLHNCAQECLLWRKCIGFEHFERTKYGHIFYMYADGTSHLKIIDIQQWPAVSTVYYSTEHKLIEKLTTTEPQPNRNRFKTFCYY